MLVVFIRLLAEHPQPNQNKGALYFISNLTVIIFYPKVIIVMSMLKLKVSDFNAILTMMANSIRQWFLIVILNPAIAILKMFSNAVLY